MGLHCISWIPYLWVQLVDLFAAHPKMVINPFPDDVIIEVLLRLPAEHVLQCRRVCRQWRALTSTPYFIEMHLKRASPSFIFEANYTVRDGVESDLFIFEEASKDEAKYCKIPRNSLTMTQHHPSMSCSSNGLVVLMKSGEINMFFIVNPITREELALTPPKQPGDVAGIFFNPLTRDYELLCLHYARKYYNYFIYAFGAKTWRKVASYSYSPFDTCPVIVNGRLYWMVEHDEHHDPHCPNAIMVYSMDREDFCALPCPEQKCPFRQDHTGKKLLVMEEKLSFCYMCSDSLVLDIWVLEDYINCSWIKTHSLNLYAISITNRCPSFVVSSGVRFRPRLSLLGIHNDELLFYWSNDGLFRYHLKLQVVREIMMRGMMMRGMGLPTVGRPSVFCTGYTKSLVKLK